MASTWGASWALAWGLSWGGAEVPAESPTPAPAWGDSFQPKRRVRRYLPPPPLHEPEPVTVTRIVKPAAPAAPQSIAAAPVVTPAPVKPEIPRRRTRAERDEELLILS